MIADASGLLVLAGAIQGYRPAEPEVIALDASLLHVAWFLDRTFGESPASVELYTALVTSTVHEWMGCRTVATEAASRVDGDVDMLEATSALILAEQLDQPLYTRNAEIRSDRVQVIRP